MSVDRLTGRLHRGEVEVVLGAVEQHIPAVILDDRYARGLAATYRLEYTGTLGILLLAKNRGLVERLRPLLDALAGEHFRVSEPLYVEILRAAREEG